MKLESVRRAQSPQDALPSHRRVQWRRQKIILARVGLAPRGPSMASAGAPAYNWSPAAKPLEGVQGAQLRVRGEASLRLIAF